MYYYICSESAMACAKGDINTAQQVEINKRGAAQ